MLEKLKPFKELTDKEIIGYIKLSVSEIQEWKTFLEKLNKEKMLRRMTKTTTK